MIANLVMSALLFTQAGSLAIVGTPEGTETHDVAYETLSAGHASEAVVALEALRADNPDDPALLINLGSAYADMGDLERAEQAYRAAMDSDQRYNLELADGSWVDSRRAARQALLDLDQSRLALN